MVKLSAFFAWVGSALLMGFAVSLGLISYYSSHLLTNIPYPDWFFPQKYVGYIWFSFYIIKGLAGWIVWKEYGFEEARKALYALIIHFILSIAFTYAYFLISPPLNQLIQSTIGSLTLLFTLVLFWRKSKLASLLLLPNIAWLLYATAFFLIATINS